MRDLWHSAVQVVAVTAVGALVVLGLSSGSVVRAPLHGQRVTVTAQGLAMPDPFTVELAGTDEVILTAAEIALLPEVRYDAVVPGLIGFAVALPPIEMSIAYTVRADTPIYGVGRRTPVARIGALNFLGEKTVVVPVSFFEEWALVLTPARQTLPSAAIGAAPAQTAGWVRIDALVIDHLVTHHIIVSVSDQTLRIVDRGGADIALFSIGVGTPSTPTPTGVTGYIQAQYLDPTQGQDTYPIALTSLHSAAADEPYDGSDGGLIGVHYFVSSSGAVSHGCLRLPDAAIAAVNQLPIGTSISIVD